MIERCRELCQKYTELDDTEIACVVSHLDMLQEIADKEESNVYIDCLTYNSQSAIIVGEAKPTNVESIYHKPLLGMVIKTYNEPAVERGFQLGVPTTGVIAIEVPSVNKIIQSVFPIVFEGKVIAVLIYEKKLEHYFPQTTEVRNDPILDASTEWLVSHMSEAIVIVDEDGRIGYCNEEARQLFAILGYADTILGMRGENLITLGQVDDYQYKMSGYTLQVKKFKLNPNSEKQCVIIKDITAIKKLESDNRVLLAEHREAVHSAKNGLFLLKGVCDRKGDHIEDEQVKLALRELSNRIMSLMMTMEFKLKSGQKNLDIRSILTELGERLIAVEGETGAQICLEVTGDEVLLDSESTNAVVLVTFELICNSMKYAFDNRTSGRIRITIEKEDFVSYITVADDGCGFEPSKVSAKSDGIKLIGDIVRERLNGKLVIKSSEKGTVASFGIIQGLNIMK